MTSDSHITWAFKRLLICLTVALSAFTLAGSICSAQTVPEPERQQLLNGLKILMWPRPNDPEVLLKLRIHSGAAFDLAGKSGGMVVLGDLLFPDQTTHDYFTDEMQGRLNVTTDYDSITITMQGHANQFEKIIEILRNALLSTPLTAETVATIRDGRIRS